MRACSFHTAVLNARLRLHLTQQEVAAQIGCKQSAISGFENGKSGALSNEKIEKFAEIVGVPLPSAAENAVAAGEQGAVERILAFCPCADCPKGLPAAINGRKVVRPAMVYIDGGLNPSFCKACGSELASGCRECLTELTPGAAFCTGCGLALVRVAPLPPGRDLEEDVARQRVRDEAFRADGPTIETYARPVPKNAGRRHRA